MPRRLLLSFFLSFLAVSAFASNYVVNDAGDASDQTPGNDLCATAGSVCTLRAAIEEANAHAGPDVITFSVAGVISPTTPTPLITGQVTIDGTTAPGFVDAPVVVMYGGGSVADALVFAPGSSSSSLVGLKIHGFTSTAVSILSSNVIVRRNYLGPVGGGTANFRGLTLSGSSCTIGGNTDGDGNVISGNSDNGLTIDGAGHTIADNFIGTDATGTAALPNGQAGIEVIGGSNTAIGVAGTNIENVISGNTRHGVSITPPATATTLVNNVIGLNVAGTAAVPNGQSGVVVVQGSGTVIGTPAYGNVISGNGEYGIENRGPSIIQNNIVGLDRTGQHAIGNALDGILVGETSTVGGSSEGEGNTVSGNLRNGIGFAIGPGTMISGNTVGLNIGRTVARGNSQHGVFLNYVLGSGVTVGAAGGGMNIISANGGDGINGFVPNSSITNNRIGTDGTGAIDLGNAGAGIRGGVEQVTANLISGNGMQGVVLEGWSQALANNIIRRNALEGVKVPGAATVSTITANSISSNGGLGIDLTPGGVTPNDPTDPDLGPNGLQNYPVITSALAVGGTSRIEGSLNSTPNAPFALHFYANSAADPSGFGEGEQFIGTTNVTTDASGNATFTWIGPSVTIGNVITSTATGPTGTSEFSAVSGVAPLPTIQFSASVYPTTEGAGTVTITVLRSGDLRATSTAGYATSDDTATAGLDYTPASGTLTFAPGESSKTFTITILNDSLQEPLERIHLTLSNPSVATPGTSFEADVEIQGGVSVPTASTWALFALIAMLAAIAMLKITK
jgi:CSLREA domain-containing protein